MKNIPACPKPKIAAFLSIASIFLATVLTVFAVSCKDEGCEYDALAPVGCELSDTLNLSTGIDAFGSVITPGSGVVDPFWKLLNNPPLVNCTDPLSNSINSSAYVVNYSNIGSNGWTNQPGASALAPVDLGTTETFGCNNARNSANGTVPYVFERSFCVFKKTSVNFNFTFKGDDRVRFELIDNITGNVLSSSSLYTYVNLIITPVATWSATAVPLPVGSYSIRSYLINTDSTTLGFSLVGNLTTTDGIPALTNNAAGCCENNTISVLNVLEEICDATFSNQDQLGNGWTFNLRDASSAIIRTAVTDINGNIFFSGLPDGTYTVEIVPQGGWIPNVPSIGMSVTGNGVTIVEFYNCR